MDGKSHVDGVRRSLFESGPPFRRAEPPAAEGETDELSCSAFNYLRGMHERAQSLEFRFRTGNRLWFPYSLLGPCRYDPSVGVLMKYTGDVVTLILLRGSNLDLPVHPGGVDLIERGLERHRVTIVREMGEDDLRRAGEGEPTIDRIEVGEFETQEEIREWLKKTAPAFLSR